MTVNVKHVKKITNNVQFRNQFKNVHTKNIAPLILNRVEVCNYQKETQKDMVHSDNGGTCRDIFYFYGYVIFCLFTYANLLFYSIFQLKQYISISK